MFVRDIIINAFIVSFKLISRIESRIIYLFIRLFVYIFYIKKNSMCMEIKCRICLRFVGK